MLKLAHFRRHKRKTLKKTAGKNTNYPFHKPEENNPPGKDSSKKISNLIGKAAQYAGSVKSKKVRFVNTLVRNVLLLYMNFLFKLFLLLVQPYQYIPTITNHTQLWWVPNVVVAHQKEGIEAVHIASGRTLCKVNQNPHVSVVVPHNFIWSSTHEKDLFCFIVSKPLMCLVVQWFLF